jgi:cytochrome c oxidase subunit 3
MSLFSRLTEKSWENAGTDLTIDPADYRPAAGTVGVWIYIGVATMLFGLVSMAYFMRMGMPGMEHGQANDWRPMPEPALIWINTGVLLLSSLAWEAARGAARRGGGNMLLIATLAAGALAFLFLAGQLALWAEFRAHGYFAAANPANSFFYLITGLHGAHLLGGLYFWGRLVPRLSAGSDSKAVGLFVDLCALYWHFLLLVWLVMLGLLIST